MAPLSSSAPIRRAPGRALGTLLLAVGTLAACSDSGGRALTSGVLTPPFGTLDIDFGMRRDLLLGTSFLGDVRHLDLNGDGIQDLVETNFLPQRMSIAFGNPDGTFTTVQSRQMIGHGFRLALGDVNGDQLVDLVVATRNYGGSGTPGVEVILQEAGTGFSGPSITLLTGEDPTDLELALAPTGTTQIFAAFQDREEVGVLEVQGGALVEVATLDSTSLGVVGRPFSLAFLDLGGNGLIDLVVGETDVLGMPDRVISYRRNAGGGFDLPTLVMSPMFKPNVDAVGDVDGNGFDDLAVAQLQDENVFLFAGDAAGLSQGFPIDFGSRTTSLIFPDLDQDGFAEAVATTLDQASIQIRPGTGPMLWGDPVHYNVGQVPRALATIMLPGDNVPDLLCANVNDLSLLVGLADATGAPTGTFRGARGYDTESGGPSAMVLADFTGDGENDVVAISRTQSTISFMQGMGDGTLQPRTVLPVMPAVGEVQSGVAAVDVDADGFLDVVSTVFELGEVRLYRNPGGDLSLFEDPLPADVTSVGTNPTGLAVGNFTDDNLPDVIVANFGDSTLQLLVNQGGGEFLAQAPIASARAPLGLICSDFDLDGAMDLAVSSESGSDFGVDIYQGDGQGGFALVDSFPVDGRTSHMATGDFDEDGLLDLVVGQVSIFGDDVFVLMNGGNLSFVARRVPIQSGPGTVFVEDLDNDQNLDIVVASTSGELKIALGNGQGDFAASIPQTGEFPIGTATIGGALGDLNGDDLPDLLTISTDTPFVWVALNASVVSTTSSLVQN